MRIVLSVVLATLLSLGTLYADKPEHAKKSKKEKHIKYKEKKHKQKNKHFSKDEKAAIKRYYESLPYGLVKKLRRTGELPPRWQEKVSVGKPLPREYFRYAKEVSYELRGQLPVGPVGSKLLQIADRVIRVEAGTNMILDAIDF